MPDPGSSTAAGIAGWKLAGGLAGVAGIAAGLSALVVMSMARPRDDREWRSALITTLVSSVGGGSAVVMHLGLQSWVDSYFDISALAGLLFACGLPGWVLVRSWFVWAQRRRGAGLLELWRELKGAKD